MRLYVGAWYGFSIIISFVIIFHLIHSLCPFIVSIENGLTRSSSLIVNVTLCHLHFSLFFDCFLFLFSIPLCANGKRQIDANILSHTQKIRTVKEDGRWQRWKMEDFMQSIYHLICFVLISRSAVVGEKITGKRCKRRTKIAKWIENAQWKVLLC